MKQIFKKSTVIMLIFSLCFVMMTAFITTESYAAGKTHLKKTTVVLTVGKNFSQKLLSANGKAITSTKVTWKSTNKSIVTVSSKGVIKAKAAGKAIVKAKYKGKTYKCTCIVKRTLSAQKKYVARKFNLAIEAMRSSLYHIECSWELSAVLDIFEAIDYLDEAIKACEGYYELRWVKYDLELINGLLKECSFYQGDHSNVGGTEETSIEILATLQVAEPIIESALENLAEI